MSMKITPEHYAILKQAVEPFVTPANVEQYRQQGLSDKHFRWDCLHASKLRITESHNIHEGDTNVLPLYDYLNDEHIDTALRSIVRLKVGKE